MELLCHGTWGGRPAVLSHERAAEVLERARQGRQPVTYGGETSCLEVRFSGGGRVVLDAGTGFRHVSPQDPPEPLHLFLSHLHADHLFGLFVNPALWKGELELVIHTVRNPNTPARELLLNFFQPPFWPVSLRDLGSQIAWQDHDSGEVVEVAVAGGVVRASCHEIRHTDTAVAWRIEADDQALVYVPDREAAACDGAAFARFAHRVDLLVHDAQYTPEEYVDHKGWGHSTYEDAVAAAVEAQARRLWLWHHASDRAFGELDRIERAARALALEKSGALCAEPPEVRVAYDGLRERLPPA